MDKQILLGTKELLKLAKQQAFQHMNALAFAVPDMTREELIQSGEFEAVQALRWIRNNDVMVLSTQAFEQYYSPEFDGKRSPDLLKECSDLATMECIERNKKR